MSKRRRNRNIKSETLRHTELHTTYASDNPIVRQDKIHWDIKDLKVVSALTSNQKKVFQTWFDTDQNLLLSGYPGTGKTFLSLYCAMSSVLSGDYPKLYIIRSVVQTRDIGFLKGGLEDKLDPFLAPYRGILSELFGRSSTLDLMIKKGLIEFIPTSFLRGQNLNGVIFLDECQNTTWDEAYTVLSRYANARLIIAGDKNQCDLSKKSDSSMIKITNLCYNMPSIDVISFEEEDCVRSGFLKELLHHSSLLGYI